MRKFISILVVAALIASCNQDKPAEEKKEDSAKTEVKKVEAVTYPYHAAYSSAIEIGKAENAKIVLDIWKAFEDNKLDETRALWADSVTMQFDGYTFHGKGDSVLAEGKAERNKYTSVVDSVDAWLPMHSTDRNQDWVAVWGREYTVNKKGKKDTADLHELFLVNNGKVSFMSQYRAHRKP